MNVGPHKNLTCSTCTPLYTIYILIIVYTCTCSSNGTCIIQVSTLVYCIAVNTLVGNSSWLRSQYVVMTTNLVGTVSTGTFLQCWKTFHIPTTRASFHLISLLGWPCTCSCITSWFILNFLCGLNPSTGPPQMCCLWHPIMYKQVGDNGSIMEHYGFKYERVNCIKIPFLCVMKCCHVNFSLIQVCIIIIIKLLCINTLYSIHL